MVGCIAGYLNEGISSGRSRTSPTQAAQAEDAACTSINHYNYSSADHGLARVHVPPAAPRLNYRA